MLRQIGRAQEEEISVAWLNVAAWVVLCLKRQDQADRNRIEVESATGDASSEDR
jgi:hypothetical protein